MSAPYDICGAEYLGGYRLRLTFRDGLVGELDLTARLEGPLGPVFEPLKDPDYFALVQVDAELGTITWPNGADLAPEVLHDQAAKAA